MLTEHRHRRRPGFARRLEKVFTAARGRPKPDLHQESCARVSLTRIRDQAQIVDERPTAFLVLYLQLSDHLGGVSRRKVQPLFATYIGRTSCLIGPLRTDRSEASAKA
jgi:hypothetical protein